MAKDGSRTIALKIAGKHGRISLGQRFAGKTLRIERLADGRVILTPVAVVPEHQLWTLRDPDASRIERGMQWAANRAPAETAPEELLPRGKGRTRR